MVAVTRFGVVLTTPAVSAELVFGQANGVNHVVDALERKRREVQLLADVFHHALVGFAIGVCVLLDIGVFAFLVTNVATGNQVVFVLGTGEVDELARINERRASDTHVRLLTAERIKLQGLLAELRAAHDGVVAEHQTAILDESRNRDELHGGDAFALLLVLRHEGAGPRGRVLDEGAGKLDAGLVRIT